VINRSAEFAAKSSVDGAGRVESPCRANAAALD